MLVRIKSIDQCLEQGLLKPYSVSHSPEVLYVSQGGTWIVEKMIQDFGKQVKLLEYETSTINNYCYESNGYQWFIPKNCVEFTAWKVKYASKT